MTTPNTAELSQPTGPTPGASPAAQAAFRQIRRWSLAVAVIVALVGSLVGGLLVGMPGVWSALIGAAIAVGFSLVTLVTVSMAGRIEPTWLFALILGGWLVKFVLFIAVLALLREQPFVHPVALWASMVAAILGTTIVDAVVIMRARIPVTERGHAAK